MSTEATISAQGSRFESTEWSVVRQAASQDPAKARAGLAELCRRYWYPIYAYIRRRSHADAAEDLTQAFFTHLLTSPIAASADPAQGKFRAYLLACCKNFLANQRARDETQKRRSVTAGTYPCVSSLPFDGAEAERRFQLEPANPQTPEKLFERQWALTLLASTLRELEQQWERKGDGPLFQHLKPLLAASGEIPARYAEIAAALSQTEAAVKKAAQRLREQYGATLRRQIAATCDSPMEVADEIRDLFDALRS